MRVLQNHQKRMAELKTELDNQNTLERLRIKKLPTQSNHQFQYQRIEKTIDLINTIVSLFKAFTSEERDKR